MAHGQELGINDQKEMNNSSDDKGEENAREKRLALN